VYKAHNLVELKLVFVILKWMLLILVDLAYLRYTNSFEYSSINVKERTIDLKQITTSNSGYVALVIVHVSIATIFLRWNRTVIG
jgi:hypothetical protein